MFILGLNMSLLLRANVEKTVHWLSCKEKVPDTVTRKETDVFWDMERLFTIDILEKSVTANSTFDYQLLRQYSILFIEWPLYYLCSGQCQILQQDYIYIYIYSKMALHWKKLEADNILLKLNRRSLFYWWSSVSCEYTSPSQIPTA